MRRILMKAMAPDPDVRYQSAAALGLDLAAFRAGGPVEAEGEDLDATRRTYRRPEPAEETRRTAADDTRRTVDTNTSATTGKTFGKTPRPAEKKADKPRSDLFYFTMRVGAVLMLACFVLVIRAAVLDYRLYERGQEFEHDVAAEQITDPNQIWDRWAELSKGNAMSFLLRGPRQAAKEKLVAAADHVIDTYRNNDARTVLESDWERARNLLLHALSMEPDDKTVRGKLRLSEGHLARIDGSSQKSAAILNDAVEKFGEAQQWMPRSPDPALGLARAYVALRDVDRAAAAFHQAEMNGYQLGNRERSQLADGYRERADRTFWDSRKVRGLPQEKVQVEQAQKDYQMALELYQRSAGYGTSSSRIVLVQTDLESVNTRLRQIDAGDDQSGDVKKRGVVANAIVGLIDALRDKSTKK